MASNENSIVAETLLNNVVNDLNLILDVTTIQCEDDSVENVVNNVMEELLNLVCESTSDEDSPSETLQTIDTSIKGTSVAVEDEPTVDILTATLQSEEVTVESVVDDVIEELLTLVCESPSGDVPPEALRTIDMSIKGTSVAVEGGKGDDANHVDVLPAKGVETSKCFCKPDGLLADPGVTPRQRASRRRRGFLIAVWRCVKRVVCGVCCLRCRYPFETE